MCNCLCLGGLCIPYPALLPMFVIVLQWISKHTGIKLPRFITKRISNNVNKTSPTKNKSEKQQQHGIDNICNDFWCLCKQRFYRKSSGSSGDSTISTTSTEISTSFDEYDSSNGEEVVIISKQEEQKSDNVRRRRRSKKTKKTPNNIQLVKGEWCMPCQESDEGR